MRKASIFALIAVLTVSLIGCSQQIDKAGADESPPSSFSAGESSETPETSEGATATAEVEMTTVAPIDESEQGTAAKAADSVKSTSGSQAATSSSPKQTAPPKTEPPGTPTPAPTDPPKTKTAYDAPYNTATIIADARAYGERIGMTWSEPLTLDNCSWEAPGQTSSVLSGERLKTAIEACIRRVKKLQADNEYHPGEFHFKLLLVPVSGGEYSFYLLMG